MTGEATTGSVRLRWGAATHVGRVRTNNEDSSLVLDNVFAVADGMGGHKAGEVASQLAVRALQDTFTGADTNPGVEGLVGAVQRANLAIIEESIANPERRGMGTTITALAPTTVEGEETLAIINVGDSRTYRLHDGELEQLTEDHSLVQEMVRDGRLTPEEATVHPQRNIVTRALGVDPELEVDWLTATPYTGDRYVLASDGLFDEIDEPKIAAVLRRLDDPDEAAQELVRLANDAGGRDNVTVVVVDVVDDGGRADAASATLAGDSTTTVATTGTTRAVKPLTTPPAEEEEREEVARAEPAESARKPSRKQRRHAKRDARTTEDGKRPKRVTWRVVIFAILFLAIAGAATGAIWWQGRNTFYVGFAGDEVTIFRGRPGGVFWLDPTVEEDTNITRERVPSSRIRALDDGVSQATLEDARSYVENLRDDLVVEKPTTTSTTTTTTTLPPPAGGTP